MRRFNGILIAIGLYYESFVMLADSLCNLLMSGLCAASSYEVSHIALALLELRITCVDFGCEVLVPLFVCATVLSGHILKSYIVSI